MWYGLHHEDAGAQLAASEREADILAVVAAYVAAHGGAAAAPLVLLVGDAGGTHKEAVAWGDALADRAVHTLAGAAD